jgi:hypothetical protein
MTEGNALDRLKSRGTVVEHLRELGTMFHLASQQKVPHAEAYRIAAEHLRDAARALAAWADEGEQ